MASQITFVGIDPGLSAGVISAIRVNVEGNDKAAAMTFDACNWWRMPTLNGDTDTRLLVSILSNVTPRPIGIWCERAQSFSGDSHHRAFRYGTHFGAVVACMAFAGLPFYLVPPVTWQNALLLIRAGKKRHAKGLSPSVQYVNRTIPDLLITDIPKTYRDGVADATCLALYGLTKSMTRVILPTTDQANRSKG